MLRVGRNVGWNGGATEDFLNRGSLLALPLLAFGSGSLTGCDAERLTENEAQETFEAVNTVAGDVVLLSRDAVEQGSAVLSVASDHGEFELSGSATDGNGWTGTTTIAGSAVTEGDRVGYALTVSFDQVEVVDGPTIDGELTLEFWVDLFGTADLQWAVGIAVDGDLDVSGSAVGTAHLHYDLTLEIDGWSVSFTASGEINGYDVSGWTFDLPIF
jgi:hypothetical protein